MGSCAPNDNGEFDTLVGWYKKKRGRHDNFVLKDTALTQGHSFAQTSNNRTGVSLAFGRRGPRGPAQEAKVLEK